MENERGMIHHRLASPSSCQKAESLGKEAQRSLEIVHPPGKHSTILSLPYLRNYPLSFTLYSNLALSRVPQSTLSALRLEFLPPFTPPHLSLLLSHRISANSLPETRNFDLRFSGNQTNGWLEEENSLSLRLSSNATRGVRELGKINVWRVNRKFNLKIFNPLFEKREMDGLAGILINFFNKR